MYSSAMLRRRLVGEVGVDPVGVRLERGAGLRLDQRELLLGYPPPAHRADVFVGLQRVLAEQLGQPPGSGVAADVHLEEPLLRVHEALRAHQVLGGVGVDLRDAVLVADHLDLTGETRQLQRAAGLRQGPADQHEPDHQPRDQEEHHGHGDVRRHAQWLGQHPEPGPPPRAPVGLNVGHLPRWGCGAGHGAGHCAVP